ncbi:MAG: delta-lactam-biosynthetic de-N-acetylase [Clostridium argentinense]|uniref:Delta-lactam-biosynthetic de-N-acetylase n=1 Tax=Clostridium faecium TaxID=2762223 RepID=A0ABR8YN47_9CLOT|nr:MULTISPECIES: delta-lactam-biosynthetic de-N-acetylase [Clostridium]MBD8045476.1 delta-lactam-biosynthetic de-N-acetylase [Clostridium faecium]MBS5824613.1 delta-lactam-biosynthetic de-N-acetylase [Clostridium argentinense]
MNKIKILTLSLCFSLIVANLPAVNNTQYNTFKNNRKSIVSAKSFEKKDILNTNENDSSNNNQQNTTKIDTNLDNTKISWWYKPNKDHTTPEINTKLKFDLNKYDALYVGNTDEKVIYLTFDEGYENGYTAKILDILKDNDVKAIFFVTSPYIRDNPDLIKRMVDEGHIVGNHSNTHPSMPTVTGDETKFNNEFKDVEDKFKEVTGEDMPKFFRPPMGEYSEKSLAMTKNLGYKTIFWSFAYHDWDKNNQPNPDTAKQTILNGIHNGSIMLVHAVSKTNTEILDEVIKEIKAQGYEFKLLP